jgi:ribosomal subunit interface protein
MEVTISAIHCTIPETMHDHAVRLSRRFDRYELRAASLKVTFEPVNGIRTAEARLSTGGAPPMVGQGTGPTYRNALNQAIDRIERQIKRARSRRRQNRRITAGQD